MTKNCFDNDNKSFFLTMTLSPGGAAAQKGKVAFCYKQGWVEKKGSVSPPVLVVGTWMAIEELEDYGRKKRKSQSQKIFL